ncbi:hypothetical protein D9611_010417 [Ephemerocybe angulata]|uniref:Uncharacterized protein n=1 Tax=Ephemerocybe angulata TaxID=980116 RepID=A0A8H5FAS3_9AGAR|nr:hypothetical protein D9611_010417 [Tulosesus angulatus]
MSPASNNNNEKKGEQTFNILPHPAKSNDPADLQRGSDKMKSSNAPMEAFHARDPHIPSEQIRNNLPEPLSREELRARQAELNKD